MGEHISVAGAPDDPLHPRALFWSPSRVRLRPNVHQDAVFTVDRDFVVHGLNRAAERMYGVDEASVVGHDIGERFPAEARARLKEYLGSVLAGEDLVPFEAVRTRQDDGRRFHVLVSASPLVDDADEIVGVAMFSRPIDDLVAAREQLRAENERFAVAASVGGVGTWEVDFDTGTLTGSPEYHRMNLNPPDSPPEPWEAVMRHFDLTSRQKLEEFIASDEMELVHEYQLMRDPDNVRIIEVAGRKVPGAPGSRGRMVGVSWDVTERRNADRRLAEMQARFRSVFDDSVAPMAIVDGDTRVVMANDAHCALLGYSREELVGTDVRLLTIDEEHDLGEMRVAMLRHGQIPPQTERCLRRKDGSLVWVVSTISMLRRPNPDDPGEYLLQLRDVTQDRETAEQLRHLADHDSLTGLLNRRAFDRALVSHVADTSRGNRPAVGALLILDLDHFKHHNDRYGHPMGDAVLVAVADVLRQRLRGTDSIGRLGGDEFAVLLPDVDIVSAEAIAADLVRLVGHRVGAIAPDARHPVTASIGLTDFSDRPDVEEVLRRADAALYEAKGLGRDRWVCRTA